MSPALRWRDSGRSGRPPPVRHLEPAVVGRSPGADYGTIDTTQFTSRWAAPRRRRVKGHIGLFGTIEGLLEGHAVAPDNGYNKGENTRLITRNYWHFQMVGSRRGGDIYGVWNPGNVWDMSLVPSVWFVLKRVIRGAEGSSIHHSSVNGIRKGNRLPEGESLQKSRGGN